MPRHYIAHDPRRLLTLAISKVSTASSVLIFCASSSSSWISWLSLNQVISVSALMFPICRGRHTGWQGAQGSYNPDQACHAERSHIRVKYRTYWNSFFFSICSVGFSFSAALLPCISNAHCILGSPRSQDTPQSEGLWEITQCQTSTNLSKTM